MSRDLLRSSALCLARVSRVGVRPGDEKGGEIWQR